MHALSERVKIHSVKLNEFYLNQEKTLLLFALWRRRPILLCELLAPFLQMTKLLPMPKLVCIALSLVSIYA